MKDTLRPMSPFRIKISKDFTTLWTTIDPIGKVALFAGLTAALTKFRGHCWQSF
jgi:small neutral amino acid transporter SnatA (MarC family)